MIRLNVSCVGILNFTLWWDLRLVWNCWRYNWLLAWIHCKISSIQFNFNSIQSSCEMHHEAGNIIGFSSSSPQIYTFCLLSHIHSSQNARILLHKFTPASICKSEKTWRQLSGHDHLLCRFTLWRHQMETFSALLALCAGNSPVTGEFPTQRPVTRSFDALFDLRLISWLSKQSWGWWFETPSRSFWRHSTGCHVIIVIELELKGMLCMKNQYLCPLGSDSYILLKLAPPKYIFMC